MGDPAGIGPEVLLRACDALAADESIRPLVVGDPHHLIHILKVRGSRDHVLADSLDLVGTGFLHDLGLEIILEDRPFGIHSDHLDIRILLFEIPPHPADRTPGS